MVQEHKVVRRIKPAKHTKYNESAKSKRLEEVGLRQTNKYQCQVGMSGYGRGILKSFSGLSIDFSVKEAA